MSEAALTEESVRKALSDFLHVRTPETRLTTMGAGSDDLDAVSYTHLTLPTNREV